MAGAVCFFAPRHCWLPPSKSTRNQAASKYLWALKGRLTIGALGPRDGKTSSQEEGFREFMAPADIIAAVDCSPTYVPTGQTQTFSMVAGERDRPDVARRRARTICTGFPARSSGPGSSNHTRSLADFITTAFVSRFSVYTAGQQVNLGSNHLSVIWRKSISSRGHFRRTIASGITTILL
jgi:hypothetical protein